MVVNFRARGISRGARKLAQTSTLKKIINKNSHSRIWLCFSWCQVWIQRKMVIFFLSFLYVNKLNQYGYYCMKIEKKVNWINIKMKLKGELKHVASILLNVVCNSCLVPQSLKRSGFSAQGVSSFARLSRLLHPWDSSAHHRRCCSAGLIWVLVRLHLVYGHRFLVVCENYLFLCFKIFLKK